jgi:hypothetical protein
MASGKDRKVRYEANNKAGLVTRVMQVQIPSLQTKCMPLGAQIQPELLIGKEKFPYRDSGGRRGRSTLFSED